MLRAEDAPDGVQIPAEKNRPAEKHYTSVEWTAVPISLVAFVFLIPDSGVLTFMSDYGGEIGLSAATEVYFTVTASCMILAMLVLGRVYDRHGALAVMVPGYILYLAGMLLLSAAETSAELLLAGVLTSANLALTMAVGEATAVERAPRGRYGAATAVFTTAADLPYAVGPIVLGVLLTYSGYRNMFLIMAGVVLISMAMFLYVMRAQRRDGNPSEYAVR